MRQDTIHLIAHIDNRESVIVRTGFRKSRGRIPRIGSLKLRVLAARLVSV